jgi:hypothetical protein
LLFKIILTGTVNHWNIKIIISLMEELICNVIWHLQGQWFIISFFCSFVCFLFDDYDYQGRIQDFKLGWKITILRQKIIFFPIAEGGAKFLGYFVWKITILRQKIIFFPILRGARAGCAPPGSAPAECTKYPCNNKKKMLQKAVHKNTNQDV